MSEFQYATPQRWHAKTTPRPAPASAAKAASHFSRAGSQPRSPDRQARTTRQATYIAAGNTANTEKYAAHIARTM